MLANYHEIFRKSNFATRSCGGREDSSHEGVFDHGYISFANNDEATEGQEKKIESSLSVSVGPTTKKTRITILLTDSST